MGTEMSSGADLFVVCKQCGSEVSPYITECPYCGSRLRRRAPKLPRAGAPKRPRRGARLAALLSRPASAARRRSEPAATGVHSDRWALTRPYATITLVVLSCAAWVVIHAEPQAYAKLAIFGPIEHHWWKLLTNAFAYGPRAIPAFVIITTVGIFGWLLERRHGPFIVLVVFLGSDRDRGAGGARGVRIRRSSRRPTAAPWRCLPPGRCRTCWRPAHAPTTRATCSGPG